MFDKYSYGCIDNLVQLSNIKIINRIANLKAVLIKMGIFMSLAAYWSIILVGTFITFN
jgi:hypothetical protein